MWFLSKHRYSNQANTRVWRNNNTCSFPIIFFPKFDLFQASRQLATLLRRHIVWMKLLSLMLPNFRALCYWQRWKIHASSVERFCILNFYSWTFLSIRVLLSNPGFKSSQVMQILFFSKYCKVYRHTSIFISENCG